MKVFLIVTLLFAAVIAAVVVASVDFGEKQLVSSTPITPQVAPVLIASIPPIPAPKEDQPCRARCSQKEISRPEPSQSKVGYKNCDSDDDEDNEQPIQAASLPPVRVERVYIIKEVYQVITVNVNHVDQDRVSVNHYPVSSQPTQQTDICSQFTGLAQDRCHQYLYAAQGRCNQYEGTANLYPCLAYYGGE